MADTGEDREIKQRVAAHQVETVRESNQLEQRTQRDWVKKTARRNKPGRSPSAKQISPTLPDPASRSHF
jgi:hypothetical protein